MKYKLVISNILVAKLYEMAYKFDIRIVIKVILGKILRSAILLILCTN